MKKLAWKGLIVECSANDVPLSPIGFLERSSKAYRDNTSLIYGSIQYTWNQTYQRCLKLASALTHLGISHGDVVATFSYNLPEIYELHFAVPMAGGILCTLNARQDSTMVSTLLAHSEAKLIFVEHHLLQTVQGAFDLLSQKHINPPTLVLLTKFESKNNHSYMHYDDLLAIGNDDFKIIRPKSEYDPISINYTSGTTSNPKAVVYTHRGAFLNSIAIVLVHNMGSRPVYLWSVPMFHSNGWCLPWGAAAQGATNICIRKVTPKAIFDNIYLHNVTHLGAAPTVLNMIVNSSKDYLHHPPLPHKVEIMTGGSPPPPQIIAKMEEMGFVVTHIYGLTETYGPATHCVCKPEWDALQPEERYALKARQGLNHLGMEEMDVKNPVTMESVRADGATIGEVMFRGNTVMSGYFKDLKATEEAFRGGWFHSGDLGVKHEDGYVEIKDRKKDVVISGGENVSTIEVENVLYSHEAVLEAAVVALIRFGADALCFVTLKEGFDGVVNGDEIIKFCRDHLPHYMAPKTVVFQDLPKTSTDNTSLVYGSTSHTWGETHQRCLKLASALANMGISRGDVVATFSYNLPQIYELHFGVPMAGGILCTLNARLDSFMVSALLRHSEAKVIFVDNQLLDIAQGALQLLAQSDTKPPILVPLTDSDYETLLATGTDQFEILRPHTELDPIAINYTSGTTARPKAVVYSHRGAYLNSLATALLLGLRDMSVCLWSMPMFNCNGWDVLWASAAQGAANIVINKVTPQAIYDNIAMHNVTHMGAVPTVMNMIVNSSVCERRLLQHTVEVLTGGAPAPPQILARMEEMGFRINQIYGLTETYGAATNCVWKPEWDALPLDERSMLKARQGLRHLAMEEVDVKDSVTMESVKADGETIGEIMFRGNTVMSGYFKDLKATEEAFKGGWFHSGDLGVKYEDGYIEIKDRMKDIIISGGLNISSVELETVLYSHEAVFEAAVVGRPDSHWGETPCAFVTLKEGFEGVNEDQLITFCKDRLPHYMAIKTVVFDEYLPTNSNGKVQKFILRLRAKAMGKPFLN
uniref:4-coumarate--CoA ligase n=1 Tax=Cannabis sativa TaxID=3483 RepID=A0A803NJC4_CANSA